MECKTFNILEYFSYTKEKSLILGGMKNFSKTVNLKNNTVFEMSKTFIPALQHSCTYFDTYYSRYRDWLRAGRPRGRSSSPGRVNNFYFSMSSRLSLGSTQPPMQCVPWALSPGVKRPWREAKHSPATRAEVEKMWIYTSTPTYAFMA
jgi:hypothetical protein